MFQIVELPIFSLDLGGSQRGFQNVFACILWISYILNNDEVVSQYDM